MLTSLSPVLAGLGFGLSLIVAIGAQNAFVLRQGLRRERVGVVVAVCIVSDLVLFTLAVLGTGAVLARVPQLLDVVRWVGAAALLAYGALAAVRAWRPREVLTPAADDAALLDDGDDLDALAPGTRAAAGTADGDAHGVVPAVVPAGDPVGAVATAVRPTTRAQRAPARPAVAPRSLRTVVLTCLAFTWLNPHTYLDTVLLGSVANTHGDDRWLFALGAAVASTLWFVALGLGARALAPFFSRPAAWRVLDGVIAATMVAIAASLVLGGAPA